MTDKEDSPDIFAIERLFPGVPELFPFNVPPIESLKEKCDVVLDTNVLLLPYATSSKSLPQIRDVYEKLKGEGRLFIPSQVAREFARQRANKLLDVFKALGDKGSKIVKPATDS
jgi:hypothetical protein